MYINSSSIVLSLKAPGLSFLLFGSWDNEGSGLYSLYIQFTVRATIDLYVFNHEKKSKQIKSLRVCNMSDGGDIGL